MQQIISPHFITIINQYGLTFKNNIQHTTLCPSKWHMEERNREEMSSWNNIKGGFGSFISLLHIFSESKTKQSRRVASFTDEETSVEKCTVVKLVVPTSYHVPPLNGLWNCGELLYSMLFFLYKDGSTKTKILHWQNEIWSILRARIAGSWWGKFTFFKQVKEIVDTWKKLCVVKLQKCLWTKPLILIVCLRI